MTIETNGLLFDLEPKGVPFGVQGNAHTRAIVLLLGMVQHYSQDAEQEDALRLGQTLRGATLVSDYEAPLRCKLSQ